MSVSRIKPAGVTHRTGELGELIVDIPKLAVTERVAHIMVEATISETLHGQTLDERHHLRPIVIEDSSDQVA